MQLLFAAGDVGGARALLPVARLAAELGFSVTGLRHGTFAEEGDPKWRWVTDFDHALSPAPDVVFYATSVQDWKAFQLAQRARSSGIPIVHLLDNWSNYIQRLYGPKREQLVPDRYLVMDELALSEAQQQGVPIDCLCVTGHPALASLACERSTTQAKPDDQISILFVSEPAGADSASNDKPHGRGYDEDSVSQLFVDVLARLEPNVLRNIQLRIAPHPRENRTTVAERWHLLGEAFFSRTGQMLALDMVPSDGVRKALHHSQMIAGMTSLLLYEGWLLGKVVASLQPGLQDENLRALEKREGVIFCDNADDALKLLPNAISDLPCAIGTPRVDLRRHRLASKRALEVAKSLCAFDN